MELLAAARNIVVENDAERRRSGRRRYLIAIALIAAATCLGYFWTSLPDARNVSLLFFGAILLAGFWLGMRVALFSSLLAFVSYNFFLVEPRLTFHFAPADLLAFATFLVGAVLVGGLSGRLSDRAREATNRLRDLTALFEASRDLSRAIEPQDAAERVVRHLEQDGRYAAIWLATTTTPRLVAVTATIRADAERADRAMEAFLASGLNDDVKGQRWFVRLNTGERALGGVAIWDSENGVNRKHDRRWIEAVLELGAVAIDRARLIAEVADATIVAEKEGLRTALLSSLSHDLRTPIATILASATSLQEHEDVFDAETKREMLDTIQDESERLNRYVANLLEMTRLESGALQVRSVLIDPGEALSSALGRMGSRLKGRRVLRAFRTSGERIFVDPVLIEQALVNFLENAIFYTPDASTILVSTEREDGRILLAIEDEGPGIPQADLARVFDKFFRGRSDRRTGAGVGLGLSVSRGLVESFGGEVRAVSPAAGGKGARMEIRLPAHPAMEPVE
jgi:two-component system sensor histidine kinase KdpD